MPLDRAELERLNSWLESKFPGGLRCPACSGGEFAPAEMISLQAGGHTVSLLSSSSVCLTCERCAHQTFFSAILSGVVPLPDVRPEAPG
jgi:hypothetical protein